MIVKLNSAAAPVAPSGTSGGTILVWALIIGAASYLIWNNFIRKKEPEPAVEEKK